MDLIDIITEKKTALAFDAKALTVSGTAADTFYQKCLTIQDFIKTLEPKIKDFESRCSTIDIQDFKKNPSQTNPCPFISHVKKNRLTKSELYLRSLNPLLYCDAPDLWKLLKTISQFEFL